MPKLKEPIFRPWKSIFIYFLSQMDIILGREKEYPQTWYYITKTPKWMKGIIVFLCGLLTGHELSKTEWGYGGGLYADRWCRWCNARFIVPKESIYFQFKEYNPRGLMSDVIEAVED